MQPVLPDKLSDLIELAVKDARSLNRDKYRPHWEYWHASFVPEDGGMCSVCLAGAVMAGTMGVSHEVSAHPYLYSAEEREKLLALDNVREGNVPLALVKINPDISFELALEIFRWMPSSSKVFDSSWGSFNDWEQFDRLLIWCSKVAVELRKLGY